jgi:hypothetical protein
MPELESGGTLSWSLQWIRKASFTLSKSCAVSVRDLPIKNRTTG